MKTSDLIKQLQTLPEFNGFCKMLRQNLQPDNCYVSNKMPETDGFYDEKSEDSGQVCYPYHYSEEKCFEIGVDELLDDHGDDFDEFVHCDGLRNAVTELTRALIKECLKCGIV